MLKILLFSIFYSGTGAQGVAQPYPHLAREPGRGWVFDANIRDSGLCLTRIADEAGLAQ